MKIVQREIDDLIFAEYNPRQLTTDQHKQLGDSLKRFGMAEPIIVNKHKDRENIIIGGHQRARVWKELGNTTIPTVEEKLPLDKEKELNVRLNKNTGEFDFDMLANNFEVDDLKEWGFTDEDLKFETEEINHGKLAEKFLIPPFSVLDARQGNWQDRKRHWNDLIQDKGESREDTLYKSKGDPVSEKIRKAGTVSILGPVLAELSNLWFGLPNCNTFDCFAGDSVFGYVSDAIGNTFIGIELRQEQADLNNKRMVGSKSKYICDDGQNVLKHIKEDSQDLLFSCPPYFDLEVYSDLPNDASNQKEYAGFLEILKNAFSDAIKCLKNNRFAVIVIGDIRRADGFYRGMIEDIKAIFKAENMPLYNEMILVNSLGTLPLRAARQMKNRKIGKTHQNVLVFYKGDPKEIQNNFKELDLSYIDEIADV